MPTSPQNMSEDSENQSTAKNKQSQKVAFQWKKWLLWIFFNSVYETLTWIAIGLTIGAVYYYRSFNNRERLRYAIIALIVEGIVMIVLKTFFPQHPKSSEVIQSDLQDIKHLLTAQKEVPRVVITSAMLEHTISAGIFPVANLTMKNTSSVIAKNVILRHGRAFFNADMREKVKQGITPQIRPTPNDGSKGDMVGGQEMPFKSMSGQWSDSRVHFTVTEAGMIFYVWGHICYSDEDGNSYVSRFCVCATDPDNRVLFLGAGYNASEKEGCPDLSAIVYKPEIVLQKASVSFTPSKPPDIILLFLNQGSDDALQVAYRNDNHTKEADFDGKLGHVTFKASIVIPRIGAGYSLSIEAFKRDPLSGDDIKKIKSGNKLFFVSVAINYEYGEKKSDGCSFEKHFIYSRAIKDLEPAPSKYWADGEKAAT
jgi:hypothetical protein